MAVNLDPLLILCVRAFTSVLLILVPLFPQTSHFTGKTKGMLVRISSMISLDAPCTPRPHIPLTTWARALTGASGMTCPSGRFCEQYYSFWIVVGVLESQLYSTANAMLHNFVDEIEGLGFIPTAGGYAVRPVLALYWIAQ
ncbi:hypothetical protein K438DRAFT_1975411 [Mycena galopus ATCC 62051]|nr:hypothetical protein K438DRAFT_1975411 [Mycena galopus ATCC 62051]